MPEEQTTIPVSMRLPIEIAKALDASGEELAQRVLEETVAQCYRTGKITRGQVSRVLDLSWAETEEFLSLHKCEWGYDVGEFRKDVKSLKHIFGRE